MCLILVISSAISGAENSRLNSWLTRPHCSLCPGNRYVHFICFILYSLYFSTLLQYYTFILYFRHAFTLRPKNHYVHLYASSYFTLCNFTMYYFTVPSYLSTTVNLSVSLQAEMIHSFTRWSIGIE